MAPTTGSQSSLETRMVGTQLWEHAYLYLSYTPQPSYPMPPPQQYSQQPYPQQISYPTQPQTQLTTPPQQLQLTQPQQLQLPSTQPPRPTQFPSQPIPNPNNKVAQPTFNTELQPFPTYLVTPVDLQEIQLRSGKVLNKNSPTIIEEESEEETPKQINDNVEIKKTSPHLELPQSSSLPPYPERLSLEKPIVHPEFDLVSELRNVCIKVPLLQAIKDIPIYAKTIRELCVKKPRRKKIEPTKIQFVGRSTDLMSGQIL
jgi:hypothetical protein